MFWYVNLILIGPIQALKKKGAVCMYQKQYTGKLKNAINRIIHECLPT